MYAEVAWALVSSGTQVQPQIIPDPGYLPDYLSVSYDYDKTFIMSTSNEKTNIWAQQNYNYDYFLKDQTKCKSDNSSF